MKSEPEVKILFDHIPEVKRRFQAASKLLVKNTLNEITHNAQQAAPPGRIKVTAGTMQVKVTPWWASFVELSSVEHAARPFLEPAANRGFREFLVKIGAIEKSL